MISDTTSMLICGIFTLVGVVVGWVIAMWLQHHG